MIRPSRNRKHTEETKRKISETKKRNYHPFRGKHITDEMKRKQSEKMKAKRWFNNGKVNVRTEICPDGFVAGMLPLKLKQASCQANHE